MLQSLYLSVTPGGNAWIFGILPFHDDLKWYPFPGWIKMAKWGYHDVACNILMCTPKVACDF